MAAFTLNIADLDFVLRQIKIAEANSTAHSGTNAIDVRAVYVDANGNVVAAGTPGAVLAIPDAHVPAGLRTVDGSFNNIVPGRELWGAADQAMPHLLTPSYLNDTDNDSFDPDGPGPAGVITNGNYGAGARGGHVHTCQPQIVTNS